MSYVLSLLKDKKEKHKLAVEKSADDIEYMKDSIKQEETRLVELKNTLQEIEKSIKILDKK